MHAGSFSSIAIAGSRERPQTSHAVTDPWFHCQIQVSTGPENQDSQHKLNQPREATLDPVALLGATSN